MNCEKNRKLFSDYIEHQLDEIELNLFEKHMKECEECSNEFDKFEKIILKIKQIQDIEPPKELKSKIMTKVMAEENKRLNAKILNFRKYSSIAATFLIVFVGFAFYNSFTKDNAKGTSQNQYQISLASENNARASVSSNEINNENGANKDVFSTSQNSVQERNKNSVINLYGEGIEVTIKTNNMELAKNFLVQNIENIKIFEENPEYVEFVLNKSEFNNLENKLKDIKEYDATIENIDLIKSEIDEIINQKIITEEGLIKFKATFTE